MGRKCTNLEHGNSLEKPKNKIYCIGCGASAYCLTKEHGNTIEKRKLKIYCPGCGMKGMCVNPEHGNSKNKPKNKTCCIGCGASKMCMSIDHGNSKNKPKSKIYCIGCGSSAKCMSIDHGNSKNKPKSKTYCIGCGASSKCMLSEHGNSNIKPKCKSQCISCGASGKCTNAKHGNSIEKFKYKNSCYSCLCDGYITNHCTICFDKLIKTKYFINGVKCCHTCHYKYMYTLVESATPKQIQEILSKPPNLCVKETYVVDSLYFDTTTQNYTPIIENNVKINYYYTDVEIDVSESLKIIIEIDENQHRDRACDFERALDIVHYNQINGLKRIIFIRFNPDEYTDLHNSKYPSIFKLNELNMVEPTDNFEYVMDSLNTLIQSIIDGEIIDISIHQGLVGYIFVNYTSTSNAIQLATNEVGNQNVVQFYF